MLILVLALTIVAMLGVVATVAIVALAEQDSPPAAHPQACAEVCAAPDSGLLGPSTVFTSAITIMGFAAFGSALGIRIERKPKKKDAQWYAKVAAFVLVIVVIVWQAIFLSLLLMGIANSWELSLYWIFSTAVILMVIAGLMTIGSSYSRGQGDSGSASGGPTLPSMEGRAK